MQLALGIPEVTFLGIPSEWTFDYDITTSEATGASPQAFDYVFLLAKMMGNFDKKNASAWKTNGFYRNPVTGVGVK